MKIGFIGTGVMGSSMIQNLMNAGHQLYIYTRTKAKADKLIKKGANWVENPKEIAKNTEIIITMVGYPEDVREIYFGEDGIFEGVHEDTIAIDMTTSTPSLAKEIDAYARQLKMSSLDAPVSGGDIGAKNGSLSIMVGGNQQVYERALTVFEVLGKNIVYQGEAGSGQHTKMCNQIAIASNMIGVMEAIIYARKAGLDPETVLLSIENGAAGSWSLSNLVPRALKDDYSPGFFIKHFVKDMKIALDEAEKMNIELPGLQLAKSMYDKLIDAGEENSGTQALIKYWN